MKLNKIILSLLIIVSFSYAQEDNQNTELIVCVDKTDQESQLLVEENICKPEISKLALIKNSLIDIFPMIAVFTSIKAIMEFSPAIKDLIRKYPTISALTAALFAAEEILPNSLNAKIIMLFEKDLMNRENKKIKDMAIIKAVSILIASKIIAGVATYKLVKNNLLLN